MANKVSSSPALASPVILDSIGNVNDYLRSLVQNLTTEFQNHATRLNTAAMADGTEVAKQPQYLKAALPSAVTYKGAIIMVSDEVGGYVAAFSDGTNWRRVTDRNVVS